MSGLYQLVILSWFHVVSVHGDDSRTAHISVDAHGSQRDVTEVAHARRTVRAREDSTSALQDGPLKGILLRFLDYADRNYNVKLPWDQVQRLFQAYSEDPVFGSLGKKDPIEMVQILDETMGQKVSCPKDQYFPPKCDRARQAFCLIGSNPKFVLQSEGWPAKVCRCVYNDTARYERKFQQVSNKNVSFAEELDQTLKRKDVWAWSSSCVRKDPVGFCKETITLRQASAGNEAGHGLSLIHI